MSAVGRHEYLLLTNGLSVLETCIWQGLATIRHLLLVEEK